MTVKLWDSSGQRAPFSHYVVSNQPTNWAVNIVTRLRCILSSLSNSR